MVDKRTNSTEEGIQQETEEMAMNQSRGELERGDSRNTGIPAADSSAEMAALVYMAHRYPR